MEFISNLFKGRLNRRNYLLANILLVILFSIYFYFAPISPISFYVFLIFCIFLLIFYFSFLVRRLHDIGHSGWFWLIHFIPFGSFYLFYCLFLKKGQQDENEYGSKPDHKIRFPADILNLDITSSSFITRNKLGGFLVLLVAVLISVWFYWFELRPSQIKHDCSWTKEYVGGEPARPAMTEADVKERGLLKNCEPVGDCSPGSGFLSALTCNPEWIASCERENKRLISVYSKPKAEVPAKERLRKTTSEEYKFCLRDHGF